MNFENAYVRWKALDVLGYLIQACEHGEIGEISRLNFEYNGVSEELYGDHRKNQHPTGLDLVRDCAIGYFQLKSQEGLEDADNKETAYASLERAKSLYMEELLRYDRFLYECFGGV